MAGIAYAETGLTSYQGPSVEWYVHLAKPGNVLQLTNATIVALDLVQGANPGIDLWFGSGKVTQRFPNGQRDDEQSRRNEEALIRAMEDFKTRHPERIGFTSGNIMSPELRASLAPSNPQYQDYLSMWAGKRGVLAEGRITGVYMIGRRGEANHWRGSPGACAERRRALALGMRVEYEDPNVYQRLEQSVPFVRRASSLINRSILLFSSQI